MVLLASSCYVGCGKAIVKKKSQQEHVQGLLFDLCHASLLTAFFAMAKVRSITYWMNDFLSVWSCPECLFVQDRKSDGENTVMVAFGTRQCLATLGNFDSSLDSPP
jgi:hypothetical protein